MLLPGILAPEGAPHHLRIIGTAPATYVLVALGLTQLFKISQSARWLPILIFLPIGLVTARDYFQIWARLPELYMAYDVYAVELVGQMARESAPGVVYVIPMDQRAGYEARHYTLDFLKQGGAPYDYVPVDEATAAARLTEAAQGRRTFRVVRWLQDKHTAADEREVVSYLLARGAQPAGEETYPAYRIETWTLPSTPARFALPAIEDGVGAVFGEVLRLEAADVSADERQVFVALRWAPLAGMHVDYKASLRLVAPDGRVAAQKDRYLRHNWHQGTSLWPAETVNEYYVLPAGEPGVYDVRVVVYHPKTLAPLPVQREAEVSLGAVRIE
jgi:hypothetical protein